MVTSTRLGLVVVPVVYVWIDRVTLRGRRERRSERGAAEFAVVAAISPAE
ncbi:MAG: hypothetical protein WCJ30_16880 [Deltaproteobacteria bacterium]